MEFQAIPNTIPELTNLRLDRQLYLDCTLIFHSLKQTIICSYTWPVHMTVLLLIPHRLKFTGQPTIAKAYACQPMMGRPLILE